MTNDQPSAHLPTLLVRAINAAAARLIALDPATSERLRALDGRSVLLQLSSPKLALQIQLKDGGFSLLANQTTEPDLSLKTSAGALLTLLANKISHGANAAIPAGKLHISGDAELARQVQLISTQFDPDWQAPFTAAFGDVLGFQIARGAGKALHWAKQSAQHFAVSASEYLREESKDTVAAAELEQFLDEVDQLSDAVQRAELRLQRLLAQRGQISV